MLQEFIPELTEYERIKTDTGVKETIRQSGNPMFDGFAIEGYTQLWQVFFYRFVNPEARMGAGLNYAGRIRNATAVLLPSGWLVIRSPGAG